MERFPNFIVPVNALGTVTNTVTKPDETIFIKMDRIIDGCEEWDNTVHVHAEHEFLEFFADVHIVQLEAALSIIYESAEADEHPIWIKNTCMVLREAGSNHYAIHNVLDVPIKKKSKYDGDWS